MGGDSHIERGKIMTKHLANEFSFSLCGVVHFLLHSFPFFYFLVPLE